MESPEHASLPFSVVIPTYQRRAVVLSSVRSLARQTFAGRFEVIVVVDGSTDGSADALRALTMPFPLTVLEQPNQGAAVARNQGAARARGDFLLFLDDDMEAHPDLLAEHDRSHREGADVVLGHLPLHPGSPPSFLADGVRGWTDRRLARLSAPDARLTLHDLLTGQLSLSRATFHQVGGFDTTFTHGGTFGNEDVDFGYRLLQAGYTIIFNPQAISWQYYSVTPAHYLKQWRQAGRADVVFARKHPGEAHTLFALNHAGKWINRYLWRPLLAVPVAGPMVAEGMRRLALTLAERAPQKALTSTLFFQAKAVAYWQGVREAGGIPQARTLRVLAYHAIADLRGTPVLEPYGVPPEVFCQHLNGALKAGFRFVTSDEVLGFIEGRAGLPRRALLLTFDDCYEELLDVVLPLLEERRIPAVAFAVSRRLGETNTWDEPRGAPRLRLLSAEGLREVARRGVEIGAHSRTHPALPTLPAAAVIDEVRGSIDDLEAVGLRRPRFFAYPYGVHDAGVRHAVRDAGIQAAFTIEPGLVQPGRDPYQLPRIEILSTDWGWRFFWKLFSAAARHRFS